MVTPVGAQEAQRSQQAGPVQVGVQGLSVQHTRGVGRGEGAERPGGRGHRGAVDVQPGVLLLPLGAAVLEPDLHLSLRQVQRQRQVEPLAHGQVAGGLELVLQGYQLLVRERCPGPSGLSVFIRAPASSSSSAASSSASLAVQFVPLPPLSICRLSVLPVLHAVVAIVVKVVVGRVQGFLFVTKTACNTGRERGLVRSVEDVVEGKVEEKATGS